MRSKLLLLLSCFILVACADEDIKETGISRERAISIAKINCKEYPDRFSFVDKAEWIPEKHFWAVRLADRSGFNGRVYKINHNGEIVGTHDFNDDRRRYNDDDGGPGPYRGGWWYY